MSYDHFQLTILPKELNEISNGVLIDTKSNQIVCLPPQAPLQLSSERLSQISKSNDLVAQQVVDGLDVFLYFFQNSWRIITPCTNFF
jgi:hypothetical protein